MAENGTSVNVGAAEENDYALRNPCVLVEDNLGEQPITMSKGPSMFVNDVKNLRVYDAERDVSLRCTDPEKQAGHYKSELPEGKGVRGRFFELTFQGETIPFEAEGWDEGPALPGSPDYDFRESSSTPTVLFWNILRIGSDGGAKPSSAEVEWAAVELMKEALTVYRAGYGWGRGEVGAVVVVEDAWRYGENARRNAASVPSPSAGGKQTGFVNDVKNVKVYDAERDVMLRPTGGMRDACGDFFELTLRGETIPVQAEDKSFGLGPEGPFEIEWTILDMSYGKHGHFDLDAPPPNITSYHKQTSSAEVEWEAVELLKEALMVYRTGFGFGSGDVRAVRVARTAWQYEENARRYAAMEKFSDGGDE